MPDHLGLDLVVGQRCAGIGAMPGAAHNIIDGAGLDRSIGIDHHAFGEAITEIDRHRIERAKLLRRHDVAQLVVGVNRAAIDLAVRPGWKELEWWPSNRWKRQHKFLIISVGP